MDLPKAEMVEAKTLKAALAALRSTRGSVALAGGTDLIPAMRRGEVKPRLLVNLKRIPGLAGVRRVKGGVRIGAVTRVAELAESDLIARDFPILVDVVREFGSPQIRNMATVGGNLCNAAPSADLALPLLVLGAQVEIAGARGTRVVEISEFFKGVNETALRRGEIVTGVIVPRPPKRTGAAHEKLGVRQAMDLAFTAAAATVTLGPKGETCRKVRIALGSVAPIPMRAVRAEECLEGRRPTLGAIHAAAAAAAAECEPISDLRASADYRRRMTQVLTRRVLRRARRLAQQEEPGHGK